MEEDFSLVCQRTDDGDGDDGACICCSIQDHISTTCVQAVMHFIITFFKLHAKRTRLGQRTHPTTCYPRSITLGLAGGFQAMAAALDIQAKALKQLVSCRCTKK